MMSVSIWLGRLPVQRERVTGLEPFARLHERVVFHSTLVFIHDLFTLPDSGPVC